MYSRIDVVYSQMFQDIRALNENRQAETTMLRGRPGRTPPPPKSPIIEDQAVSVNGAALVGSSNVEHS